MVGRHFFQSLAEGCAIAGDVGGVGLNCSAGSVIAGGIQTISVSVEIPIGKVIVSHLHGFIPKQCGPLVQARANGTPSLFQIKAKFLLAILFQILVVQF